MTVDVDNTNLGQEISLTPEIYYMLSDQDRSQLEDPKTRKDVLNKLESEAIFEHEDLIQLESFLAREDRKRLQDEELHLDGSNIQVSSEKQAAMERFLSMRTAQEEEEDERIRQIEIQVAIEQNSHNEHAILERAELFLFRVAVLSILEQRLQEERGIVVVDGDESRREEVNSSDEDDLNPEEARLYARTRRQYEEDDPDAIHSQPETNKNKRTSSSSSTKYSNRNNDKEGEGCLDGFWKCIASCISCCI